MGFSLTHLTAISIIFSALIIARSSGGLHVLRHYPTCNGTAIKLTCISEDDGAALVWNYDSNEKDFNSGQKIDTFTNFQPKNPTSKNLTEYAIWNSTKCFTLWGKNIGWNVVESALVPMGPVFDYRWEGLKEIVLKESINRTEYQYVRTVKDYSGTVIFSVRGSSKIQIFLCENKEPWNGQCFWIIIGDSKGKRSEIRSCVNGTIKKTDGSIKEENCVNVATVVHGAEDVVVDAYVWRTFRLEWNSEKKEIRIFNETEAEPFLEGNVDHWHPVSHLSMKSESISRIRFHFYEYFLTRNNNAVISTSEFILHDKNFCVEVLVGLCPECKLNVTLIDDESRDIPIASISGEGKSVHDKLMSWRSVRLNATLPNLNSRLIKLKMVPILMKNEVEGQWAIDKFRKCKSVVGLRKSTITVNREMMADANPFWPTVKCQKLSYTENIIVDSISGSPYRDRDASISRRKSRDVTTARQPSSNEALELYEADLKNNSISLRLKPFHPNQNDIEKYVVSIEKRKKPTDPRTYDVSQGLECSLWEESVCLENFPLPKDIISLNSSDGTSVKIMVSALKDDDQKPQYWQITVSPNIDDPDSNTPMDATWEYKSHGIGTLKWGYPSLPKTKIEQFNITITREISRLLPSPTGVQIINDYLVVHKVKMEYTKELQLFPSTDYTIYIISINQRNAGSNPAKVDVKMPSGVIFDTKAELEVTNNGTWIELKIPAVFNVTKTTWIEVSIKGIWACEMTNKMIEQIVQTYKVEFSGFRNLTFDANETTTSAVDEIDCYLNHGEKYELNVKVVEKFSNATNTLPAHFFTLPSIDGGTVPQYHELNLIWPIMFPILAIFLILLCLLFVLYYFRNGIKGRFEKNQAANLTMADNDDHKITSWTPDNSTPPSDGAINRLSIRQSPPDVVPHNPHSCLVKIEDFEETIKEALASGLLDSQFEKFPRGLIKPCEYGKLPENVAKNRYKDLIAYDETRVILKKVGDDPHSDYINASYIQGYKKERAYIATQGPKRQTVRDFWRMIWEEDVRVICMLANVKEGGKIKCEQYWPEVGSKAKYGDVLVTNMNHQVFADYTFRTFKLGSNQIHREVTHLHYTGWPDHGIPMYTQSLVSYLKKLQDTSTGNGPVVVHCSAGVGRTGTIILCDICLKQAFAEKTIDVPGVTSIMRNSRANMVDTAQQYKLANLTIMESLVVEQTQIPCNRVLAERIKELKKTLPLDIQRLNDSVWEDRALHALAAPTRPKLNDEPVSVESEGYNNNGSNSINAVSVDGVKMKKQHLASRLPTVSTLSKFWKLIYERGIELVVILERPDEKDTIFCDLTSNESILIPVAHLQVERKAIVIKEDHYLIDKLSLSDTSKEEEKPHPVTVVTCNGWGHDGERNPPTPHALVSLWQASEKIPRKESPTLVLCRDGVTGCGLYLALSFLLERMAVERECDVISAVRAVRRSKPEFVKSLKQFEYLYDAAVQYMKCFDTYSNFS